MDFGRVGYSLFMVLATIVAGWLYRRDGAVSTLSSLQKIGIAIGGLIGATFAAKLPFILTSDPSAGVMLAWFGDGKTILWGLAGGYLGVEVAKWSLHVTERTGDHFVIPVAAAIAIGRLGCLCQGCCYGIATNQAWGMRSIPADGGELLRHPAPIYEFVFHAGFAWLAWNGIRRSKLKSGWMLVYLISYCGFRFVSEWWREEREVFLHLTFYQCSAIVFGSVFAILLVSRSTIRPDEHAAV
ncbi:MAG: prolipoprotein diacylglyceryl transferase family protein [Planctomycetota bacterium]